MATLSPVKAAALPDIPQRLQQLMSKNRANLEKANMWEYLLWVRDVEKVVNEDKLTRFVHTYQLKTKSAYVGGAYIDFSTMAISRVTALPDGGVEFDKLPDLRKAEAEDIFGYKFKWGKETNWDYGAARHHWKAWFEFVNTYLLFRPLEQKMEEKYVVAAIRSWEGTEVNWAKLVQLRINEEIQERRVIGTKPLTLYSAFYIGCLCENVSVLVERPPLNYLFSSPPSSPTLDELEVQLGKAKCRIAELERQLSDRKDKIEQIQERSAESLQQINQMLQEKLSDHRKHEQLQSINAALKIQLQDSERELKRLQEDGQRKDTVRSIMVDQSVNTMPFESEAITPSLTAVQPDPRAATATPPLPLLSMETCVRLWSAEGKVFPQFNLHHLYELQRDLFLIMAGKQFEGLLSHEEFLRMWEFSVELKVENSSPRFWLENT